MFLHSARLDSALRINVLWKSRFVLFFFFFGSSRTIWASQPWTVHREQCTDALFMVPQIPLFSHFFIKNGSHDTIYTFKNYFATVFSASIFSFSKNKLNPNGSIVDFLLDYLCPWSHLNVWRDFSSVFYCVTKFSYVIVFIFLVWWFAIC